MPEFQLIDVFGTAPFSGNPLAVVLSVHELPTADMQSITQWLNLSETTFLLPATDPQADYRVRIFTLERELPFAGHPTLGTCHAWLTAGGTPRRNGMVLQQCGAGLIPIRVTDHRLAFRAPPLLRAGAVDTQTRAAVTQFLRASPDTIVDMQWADNGPGWVAVLFASAEAVLDLRPAATHPTRMEVGVVGPYPVGHTAAFELRAFFTDQHNFIREDPVTGSLNASVAQYLYASGRATGAYVAAQGTCLGRQGRVHIDYDSDGTAWIGGQTRTLFSGQALG